MSSISSLPPSEVPPSSRLPGRSSGNGPYILGIVAFGAMSVALLLYWKQCMSSPVTPPPVETTTATAPPEAPGPMYAPPPPPEPEELDAGSDAQAPTSGGGKPGAAGAGGACAACGKGVSSSAVESKVAGQASLARGCYNRALRTETVSGTLTVSVSVGADGRVCSASIVNDSVGSPSISNCVLSKFHGTSFPRPKRGCVVINVPIAFKTKK